MKIQKTIKLAENYRINNGNVQYYASSYNWSADDPYENETGEWKLSKIKIGAHVVLGSTEYVGPNKIKQSGPDFFISFDEEGIPGNTDHTIKKTNGWRGTTDDVAVYAHGLREIIKIRELHSGIVSVTVGPEINSN